jgi:hypothetical protein
MAKRKKPGDEGYKGMSERKEGHKVLFIEAPSEWAARLKRIATWKGHSMTAEAVEAIKRHVLIEEVKMAETLEQAVRIDARVKEGLKRKPKGDAHDAKEQ